MDIIHIISGLLLLIGLGAALTACYLAEQKTLDDLDYTNKLLNRKG